MARRMVIQDYRYPDLDLKEIFMDPQYWLIAFNITVHLPPPMGKNVQNSCEENNISWRRSLAKGLSQITHSFKETIQFCQRSVSPLPYISWRSSFARGLS